MNVLPVLEIRRRTKDANRRSTAIVANIKMADAVFLKQEVEYVGKTQRSLFITLPPLNICLTVRGESLFYSVP